MGNAIFSFGFARVTEVRHMEVYENIFFPVEFLVFQMARENY